MALFCDGFSGDGFWLMLQWFAAVAFFEERWLFGAVAFKSNGSVAVVAMALYNGSVFERWLWALASSNGSVGVVAMALFAMALPSDGFSSVGSSDGSL